MHFPSLSCAAERPVAVESSPPLRDGGLGGKLLVGKEKNESGMAEALWLLVRQNIVQVLFYSEAAKQLIIHTKH